MSTLAQVPPFGAPFWLRGIARGLLLTWGLFWIWFNVMSAFGEMRTEGPAAMLGHLAMAAVVLVAVAIAWRWDAAGGLTLLALAAAMAWFFRGMTPQTAAILLGPAALAGALLLIRAGLKAD